MYYIKYNNLAFAQQLGLLATNMHDLLIPFGFNAADETSTKADYAYIQWLIEADNMVEKQYHEYKDYLHTVRHNANTGIAVSTPLPLALPDAPTLVMAGIQARYAQKINQIKGNKNCSDDLLKKLDAIASVAHKDNAIAKPDPKVSLDGGFPVISFHKYGYTAANLYKDSGTGYSDQPYKTITTNSFKDQAPLPIAGHTQLLKYKMMYLLHDVETGVISDEISIVVGAK